jgi:hypothetical protein
MTLIEIIKTSLLGFSTLFILSWLFFYIFLKIKKSNKKEEVKSSLVENSSLKVMPVVQLQPSPVYVQPVSYNQNFVSSKINSEKIHRVSPKFQSRKRESYRKDYRNEKYVVFNKNQYSFYNI